MNTVPGLYRQLKRRIYVPVHLIFLTETHVLVLTESVEVAGEPFCRNVPEVHTDAVTVTLWQSYRLSGCDTKQGRTYFCFLSDCLVAPLNITLLVWYRTNTWARSRGPCEPPEAEPTWEYWVACNTRRQRCRSGRQRLAPPSLSLQWPLADAITRKPSIRVHACVPGSLHKHHFDQSTVKYGVTHLVDQ